MDYFDFGSKRRKIAQPPAEKDDTEFHLQIPMDDAVDNAFETHFSVKHAHAPLASFLASNESEPNMSSFVSPMHPIRSDPEPGQEQLRLHQQHIDADNLQHDFHEFEEHGRGATSMNSLRDVRTAHLMDSLLSNEFDVEKQRRAHTVLTRVSGKSAPNAVSYREPAYSSAFAPSPAPAAAVPLEPIIEGPFSIKRVQVIEITDEKDDNDEAEENEHPATEPAPPQQISPRLDETFEYFDEGDNDANKDRPVSSALRPHNAVSEAETKSAVVASEHGTGDRATSPAPVSTLQAEQQRMDRRHVEPPPAAVRTKGDDEDEVTIVSAFRSDKQEALPEKRKPGRPRKHKRPTPETNATTPVDAKLDDKAHPIQAAPRRRGRPRRKPVELRDILSDAAKHRAREVATSERPRWCPERRALLESCIDPSWYDLVAKVGPEEAFEVWYSTFRKAKPANEARRSRRKRFLTKQIEVQTGPTIKRPRQSESARANSETVSKASNDLKKPDATPSGVPKRPRGRPRKKAPVEGPAHLSVTSPQTSSAGRHDNIGTPSPSPASKLSISKGQSMPANAKPIRAQRPNLDTDSDDDTPPQPASRVVLPSRAADSPNIGSKQSDKMDLDEPVARTKSKSTEGIVPMPKATPRGVGRPQTQLVSGTKAKQSPPPTAMLPVRSAVKSMPVLPPRAPTQSPVPVPVRTEPTQVLQLRIARQAARSTRPPSLDFQTGPGFHPSATTSRSDRERTLVPSALPSRVSPVPPVASHPNQEFTRAVSRPRKSLPTPLVAPRLDRERTQSTSASIPKPPVAAHPDWERSQTPSSSSSRISSRTPFSTGSDEQHSWAPSAFSSADWGQTSAEDAVERHPKPNLPNALPTLFSSTLSSTLPAQTVVKDVPSTRPKLRQTPVIEPALNSVDPISIPPAIHITSKPAVTVPIGLAHNATPKPVAHSPVPLNTKPTSKPVGHTAAVVDPVSHVPSSPKPASKAAMNVATPTSRMHTTKHKDPISSPTTKPVAKAVVNVASHHVAVRTTKPATAIPMLPDTISIPKHVDPISALPETKPTPVIQHTSKPISRVIGPHTTSKPLSPTPIPPIARKSPISPSIATPLRPAALHPTAVESDDESQEWSSIVDSSKYFKVSQKSPRFPTGLDDFDDEATDGPLISLTSHQSPSHQANFNHKKRKESYRAQMRGIRADESHVPPQPKLPQGAVRSKLTQWHSHPSDEEDDTAVYYEPPPLKRIKVAPVPPQPKGERDLPAFHIEAARLKTSPLLQSIPRPSKAFPSYVELMSTPAQTRKPKQERIYGDLKRQTRPAL